MKTKFKLSKKLIVAGIVFSGIYLISATVVPVNPDQSCMVSSTDFKSWFASGDVTLNGVVTPANSLSTMNPNCDFYSWSVRMFLWMTSPDPVNGQIMNGTTFFDVSAADSSGNRIFIPHTPGMIRNLSVREAQKGPHGLPLIRDKAGMLFEVEKPTTGANGKQLILDNKGNQVEIGNISLSKNKLVISDKAGKNIEQPKALLRAGLNPSFTVQKISDGKRTFFVNGNGDPVDVEAGQAGGSGALMSQNGSLVYYVSMVNDIYAYFTTGVKKGALNTNVFPTTQADINNIVAYAASKGKTISDPNALAIEVKTSWVEASSLPGTDSYITMMATIPVYTKTSSTLWTPSNTTKTVLMAMVGIHVVGSTAGHPEMLWATFEHQDNTPNSSYSYVNSIGQTVNVPASTAGNWTLSQSNSPGPYNTENMKFVSTSGQSTSKGNIAAISPNTISPSDVMRMTPWGAASDVSPNPIDVTPAASNSEIISINNSVRGMLANRDVRGSYIFIGCTWTIGGTSPSTPYNGQSTANGIQVGTSQLANSTMETFHQNTNGLYSTTGNCFRCHTSNSGAGNPADTAVSHIFGNMKPLPGF